MNSSGAPDSGNPDGTQPIAVDNIQLDVAADVKPEVLAEVPKVKVSLMAQPIAKANPTSDELRQVLKDNPAVRLVILPDDAGNWHMSRIETTKDDPNNPRWYLVPENLEVDAAISPEITEVLSILKSSSSEVLLDTSSEANAQISTLMKVFNKENSRRKLLNEFMDTEQAMETRMKEFDKVVSALPRTPEINVFMAPYRELLPMDFFKQARELQVNATSVDEWIILKAEAIINTFLKDKPNAEGQFEMTPEFSERLRILTDTLNMFENFSTVFGSNVSMQPYAAHAIDPVQRIPRYDMVSGEIVRQLEKITPQSPELAARLTSVLERFGKIKQFTMQANETKRQVESLSSILATQGVLGVMARDGFQLQATANGNGTAQANVARDFLMKLNAVASAMIKSKHHFSEPMESKTKDFLATVKGYADVRIKENRDFASQDGVQKFQAANVLYVPLMNSLTEAFLLHSKNGDLADGMLTYIKDIDKKLNREGRPGIIFSKAPTIKPSFEKVFATLQNVNPEIVSEVVTKMFDNLQAQLASAQGNQANPAHALAHQNAYLALNAMGPQAIAQWNKNAAEKFYDLSMPNPVAYAKLVGAAKTEAERTQVVLNAVKSAAANYPELAKQIDRLPVTSNPQEQRQNILFAVLQSYQDSYLDGRFKQNFATAKNPALNTAETAIEAIEKALADKGQRGLFGENLDAKGVAEKEQVIMPAIAMLREDQAKKLIENLYNRAKAVAVKANPTTADEYVFRNAFKELKRLESPAALQYWMENANKETDKNITSRMAMTDAEMKGKIQEEVVAGRFKAFTGQAIDVPANAEQEKDEFELDTPIKVEHNDDEELIPETPTSPQSPTSTTDDTVQASNSSAPVEKALPTASAVLTSVANLEILGHIAEQLKAGRVTAAGYGFKQMQLWDNFSQSVQAISESLVDSRSFIKAEKFYGAFMQAFMNGYLIHEKGQRDIFSDAIRPFIERVDTLFHSFGGSKGVVYADAASMPGTTDKDRNALQTLDANPRFRDAFVATLFTTLKSMIERKDHGAHEELHYNRTLNAINSMGAASVAQWNKLADASLYELTIKDDRLSWAEMTKVSSTEDVRRKLILGEIKSLIANKDVLVPNKQELLDELSMIEKTAAAFGSRTQMLQEVQGALLSTFTTAYLHGRSKKMGFSHQSPELKAVDALIIKIEKNIVSHNQKNIFVEKPGDIKEFNVRGTYALADSVFNKTKELSQPQLEIYIQKLYTDVRRLMARQDGESQKIFVNLVKLLNRSGSSAMEQWNAVALKDNPKLALPDTRIVWKEEKAKALFLGQVKTDPAEKDVKDLQKLVASEIKKADAKSKADVAEQKVPESSRPSVSVSSQSMFAKTNQPASPAPSAEPRTPTPSKK